jgi:AcrR family transcriptional regulator
MADEISGKGDPIRTLELLWGIDKGPRRGPKPKLLLADIVRKAVEIADSEGIDAVSTRRLAESFSISPMSFYTYVPGKAELIDLMLDHVAGESMREGQPRFVPDEWRQNLAMIARALREFYLRHPWVLEIGTHRPVLGPNTLRASDIALSAIDGLGLSEIEMDMVFTLIANYVHGAVRDAAREKMVNETTGMTDTDWWYRVLPFLETLDFSPYPVVSRVGAVTGQTYGAHDPPRAFEFGLERVLDGLALFIAARKPKTRREKRSIVNEV